MEKKSSIIKKFFFMAIQNVKDLKVYLKSFDLAMEIFRLVRLFPADEKYSLSSQMVRSARSVSANIREGYAKRHYEQVFIKHLVDALGSCEETRCWLEFSQACEYITNERFEELDNEFGSLSAMLFQLQKNWKKI